MNKVERTLNVDLHSLRFAAGAALSISVAAYFIFISQHLIGNHALRMPWLHGSEQMGNGRWLAPMLGYLHYDADVPVVMPVLGLIFGLAAGLLASALWRVGPRRAELALIYMVILVFPTNLAHFYYSFQTPLFFVAWLFAAVAVVAADRMSLVRIAVGAVAVLLMLASYQAALGVFAVLASTAVIARLANLGSDETPADVKEVTMAIVARLTAGVLGGVAYYLSLKWFGVSGAQALQIESLADLLARIRTVNGWAFEHLWITQPDLISPIKITLLLVLALAALITLVRVRRSFVRLALVALSWLGAVVGTKAIFLVSDPMGSAFEYRYNTSLNFLHAFSIFVILAAVRERPRPWWAALTLASLVVAALVQADLVRQHVLLRGQQHDLAIANRILARIENLPDLNQYQTYDLIRVGHYSRFRWNLYKSGDWRIDRAGDGHMDFGEITDRWVDEDVFRLLGSSIRFQQTSTDPRFTQKYTGVIESGVLDDRQPWPHSSSVFIDGDRIIVFMQR